MVVKPSFSKSNYTILRFHINSYPNINLMKKYKTFSLYPAKIMFNMKPYVRRKLLSENKRAEIVYVTTSSSYLTPNIQAS